MLPKEGKLIQTISFLLKQLDACTEFAYFMLICYIIC